MRNFFEIIFNDSYTSLRFTSDCMRSKRSWETGERRPYSEQDTSQMTKESCFDFQQKHDTANSPHLLGRFLGQPSFLFSGSSVLFSWAFFFFNYLLNFPLNATPGTHCVWVTGWVTAVSLRCVCLVLITGQSYWQIFTMCRGISGSRDYYLQVDEK